MKKIFIALLLFTKFVNATNYYLSDVSGSDANAGTLAAPWKSIAKLNASWASIVAGDSILFKGGETFYGSIVVGKSGTAGNAIVISCYGSGKAILSGFTTASGWANQGGNIWTIAGVTAKNNLNLVIKDGVIQKIGRHPNSTNTMGAGGWLLSLDSSVNTTAGSLDSFTSATTITYNWTGAEIIIRKNNWDNEQDTVQSITGNRIVYRQPYVGNIYPIKKTYGFFFQSHINTLDQDGEWYLNPSTNAFYMYVANNNPAGSVIKFSTVDTAIYTTNRNYITIKNLSFEGFNQAAIFSYFPSTGFVNVANCDFNFMGKSAITLWQTSDCSIDNCTAYNCLGNAFFIRGDGNPKINNSSITNCYVYGTCLYAGMEISGDASGRCGVTVKGGDNLYIAYNKIINSGYMALEWGGVSNTTVEYNFADSALKVRQDGGIMYRYVTAGDWQAGNTHNNLSVHHNILLNGFGNPEGTSLPNLFKARGIYSDEGTNNVFYYKNIVANVPDAGLYCNSNGNLSFRENIVYNAGLSWQFNRFKNAPRLAGMTVKQNQFHSYASNYSDQQIESPSLITVDSSFMGFGKVDSNYLATSTAAQPFSFMKLYANGTNYNLKTVDFAYMNSPLFADLNSLSRAGSADSVRLVYRLTPGTINLGATYQRFDNGLNVSSVILGAYEGMLLKYVGPMATNVIPYRRRLKVI